MKPSPQRNIFRPFQGGDEDSNYAILISAAISLLFSGLSLVILIHSRNSVVKAMFGFVVVFAPILMVGGTTAVQAQKYKKTLEQRINLNSEAMLNVVSAEGDLKKLKAHLREFSLSDSGDNPQLNVDEEGGKLNKNPLSKPLYPPPTSEEYHEALLNPWPGHTPEETISRNRGRTAH